MNRYRFSFFGASCLGLLVMASTTGSLWAAHRPRLLTLPGKFCEACTPGYCCCACCRLLHLIMISSRLTGLLHAEPAGPDAAEEVGAKLEAVWILAAEPLLFSLAGSALRFSEVPQSTVLKSLLVVAVGARMSPVSVVLPSARCTPTRLLLLPQV